MVEAMRLGAEQRLRRAADFEQVRRHGRRVHCGAFVLQVLRRSTHVYPGGSAGCRFAVIASRRVGNAVKRNRAKRLFREILRFHQGCLPWDCDAVVVVRVDFEKYPFVVLKQRFTVACAQLRKAG